MPKLLWVLLPLLPPLVYLAARLLRGRPPARRELNAWSSVLLLAYLAATAGFGLFWVAQQQLPVFDWHYLFGYATLGLLALHLSLNFSSAWRVLRGRPAPTTAREQQAGRRWMLVSGGAGLALLAVGTAFVAGLRLGRGQRGVLLAADGATTQPPVEAPMALVDRFHRHSSQSRSASFTGVPAVNWGAAPPPFKRYAQAPRVALPPAARHGGVRPDSLLALGTALWHTAGVTERRPGLVLRASPSSGALFSTELYLAVGALPGLAPGLWHYDAEAHALERLRADPAVAALPGLPGGEEPGRADAFVIATAVFRRTGRKYRDRSYRYVLADLGHALENLRQAAVAVGWQARLVPAFDGPRLAAGLALNEDEEGVLALVSLRAGSASGPPADTGLAALRCVAPRAAAFSPPPLPRELPPLGVTGAVHRATSLQGGASPPWAGEATGRGTAGVGNGGAASAAVPGGRTGSASASTPTVALLPADSRRVDVLPLIATRRSVRRFAATPLSLRDLAGVLAGLVREGSLLSPALRIDVVAHAVDGLPPGAWRFDPARRTLLPRRVPRALRAEAR
ncbi:SagB family peptide dehydrogenase, partial [uncultured Azohydromonas sp.]|uniref:SagB family peptide dehydrogenase n=1 Tax=uncultured Azohydromonas sp. TaxID=487342 RepID=UPI0026074056